MAAESKRKCLKIMILIPPSILCKFDWKEVSGSINKKASVDSLNFCKACIVRKGIVKEDRREDRRELSELVVIYLSLSDFKMRKTGAVHYARFLAKAINYLKMQLLSSLLDFVFQNNVLKEEIKLLTEFVTCFYAK